MVGRHRLHPANRKAQNGSVGCCVPGHRAEHVWWHDPACFYSFSLPCTLRRRTSKQRPGTLVQNPKCMKFSASRSSPLSPAHLCPAYMLICGVFFYLLVFPFEFFQKLRCAYQPQKNPRLRETFEPDFHTPVGHREDHIFTDMHPTHALSSIPSGNQPLWRMLSPANAGSFMSYNLHLQGCQHKTHGQK